jgi:hypothetical protein
MIFTGKLGLESPFRREYFGQNLKRGSNADLVLHGFLNLVDFFSCWFRPQMGSNPLAPVIRPDPINFVVGPIELRLFPLMNQPRSLLKLSSAYSSFSFVRVSDVGMPFWSQPACS